MSELILWILKYIFIGLYVYFAACYLHSYIHKTYKKSDLWFGIMWTVLALRFVK